MRRRLYAALALIVLMFVISPVFAEGTIRLDPHGSYYGQPIMLSSPADFTVSVQPGGDPTYDPHIFLVMTEECYIGLHDVTVTWDGGSHTFASADWTPETDNNVKVPSGTTPGAGYTVASLKDHLNTTGAIYWAFADLFEGPLTQTGIEFTVTLDSDDPRMLVYVLGKTEGSDDFDNRVPPTQAGFVIPEPATIAVALVSFAALFGYGFRRRIFKLRSLN